MSKFQFTVKTLTAALFLLAANMIAQLEPGNTAYPAWSPDTSYEITAKRDLLVLMMAYPECIDGLEKENGGRIYVIMRSGEKILYDDMKQKTFEEKLYDADLQDMMEQLYPLSDIVTLMEKDCDPGRIRDYEFLRAVYGSTKSQIESRLKSVALSSGNFPFNSGNGAADALTAAFKDISALLKNNPNIYSFVYPVNGTYNYRVIAGTSLLSPHAFGIAVDLKSNACDYWKWATKEQGQSRLDAYPKELVKVLEEHYFIWGGKWCHFDFLHFEYRPELIIKATYSMKDSAGAANWHEGFPETELTLRYIGIIDNALN